MRLRIESLVDEYAGLYIAFGVDVQIVPSTGNAATHIFRIVLEIHRENSLGLSELANPIVYLLQ